MKARVAKPALSHAPDGSTGCNLCIPPYQERHDGHEGQRGEGAVGFDQPRQLHERHRHLRVAQRPRGVRFAASARKQHQNPSPNTFSLLFLLSRRRGRLLLFGVSSGWIGGTGGGWRRRFYFSGATTLICRRVVVAGGERERGCCSLLWGGAKTPGENSASKK
jgi:hypothetical protein